MPGSSARQDAASRSTVSERSTGELSFGAGFSTSDGPLGDIRLSERNLLGRGQSVRAEFTISARTQQLDFSFTEPYFLDRDLAAGFDLFRRTTDFQSEGSFDQKSIGGTLRASYPAHRALAPRACASPCARTRSATSTTTPRASSRTRRART